MNIDLRHYRVSSGRGFRLRDHRPNSLPKGVTRDTAVESLAEDVARLRKLQEMLYAERSWSMLLILQGMDGSGKDSTIRHVMSGVNPQGCAVHSFKAPTDEELDHDLLWRTTVRLPRRGHIGIFNRSYYEEVLVVRVHPEILDGQRLPRRLVGKAIWRQRFEDIVDHERHLARSGTAIVKVFLHLSKDEQRRQLLERLDQPEKQWKVEPRDAVERQSWPKYMRAYDEMIRQTSTEAAPWYVVPADRKWWARTIVARIMSDTLAGLKPRFPAVTPEQRREFGRIREALGGGRDVPPR